MSDMKRDVPAMNVENLEKLSGFWSQQLHSEFEEICWQYNIQLRPPVIEVTRSKSVFGSWQADTRTLRVSSFLITSYSWAVTLNVFKHEIAHQMCSEIFRSREVSHGEDFQKSCEIIGLPKEYRGAGGDLSEHLCSLSKGTSFTSRGRRFIEKVEKLLALAQSANEHEAALAMQKANELIDKYNVECMETGNTLHYTYLIINKKKKRIASYERRICAILIEFFHVKVITSSLYDPLTNQTHKTMELLGTIENVAIAEYCYHFLENQLAFLWQQNRHRYTGKVRTEKYSYYLGLLKGFYRKLSQQNKKSNGGNTLSSPSLSRKSTDLTSLIRVEEKKLETYVHMRFPRLRKIRRRGPKIYRSTYNEGIKTGKTLTLAKGISEEDGNRGKMLS